MNGRYCFSTFAKANKPITSSLQLVWLSGFLWPWQDASAEDDLNKDFQKVSLDTAEDDDDLDLFGDETEEDKKAAEEREAAKKPAKKKESEMSFDSWL